MKTKFILNGGFSPVEEKIPVDRSGFYREILKDSPEKARVLVVLFAKDEPERIKKSIPKITSAFIDNKGGKDITVEIADKENFLEQIKSSDIIYFSGGRSLLLLEALKEYPGLEKLVAGKTVAGESAGANVLCKFFYSPLADSVSVGLGILPIKNIPHYKEEYEGKLDEVGLGLEELLLPEYSYKVFYK